MVLLCLSLHFLWKVLYETKEILSICVTQEITEKNDETSIRFMQSLAA